MAGAGDAVDELFDDVGIHAAEGQIVEKEERLGAEGEDVVDAVINEIAAHGGVDAHGRGDFQLAADAVGAGNEHRLVPALYIQGKQAAEGSDAADDPAREGTRSHAANPFLGLFRARDIHAGFGIAHRWRTLFQGMRATVYIRG